MKPFRFSLQRVLDVKTLMEKQQRQKVADAHKSADEARRSLAKAEALRQAAVEEGNDLGRATDPMLRVLSWRRRERLLRRVQKERLRLEDAARRLDDERGILVQRHKDRRSLELLSESQRERHREDEGRRQQSVVDDLFIGRFARGTRGDVHE